MQTDFQKQLFQLFLTFLTFLAFESFLWCFSVFSSVIFCSPLLASSCHLFSSVCRVTWLYDSLGKNCDRPAGRPGLPETFPRPSRGLPGPPGASQVPWQSRALGSCREDKCRTIWIHDKAPKTNQHIKQYTPRSKNKNGLTPMSKIYVRWSTTG